MKALTLQLVFALICLSSCGERSGPPRLERAWKGEGTFTASAGSMDVRAQLEILSDGSYRFLFLEPGILMLTGVEKGSWSRDGALLTLSPAKEKPEEDGSGESVLGSLRKSSPENLRVKQLSLGEGLRTMTLSDGSMQLEFTPNPEATRKLEEAWEVKLPQ